MIKSISAPQTSNDTIPVTIVIIISIRNCLTVNIKLRAGPMWMKELQLSSQPCTNRTCTFTIAITCYHCRHFSSRKRLNVLTPSKFKRLNLLGVIRYKLICFLLSSFHTRFTICFKTLRELWLSPHSSPCTSPQGKVQQHFNIS